MWSIDYIWAKFCSGDNISFKTVQFDGIYNHAASRIKFYISYSVFKKNFSVKMLKYILILKDIYSDA